MKRLLIALVFAGSCLTAFNQNVYWVFFTDKANTAFDPYSYFDAKAIGRYRQNHADLYDSTNFPLNAQYSGSVARLSQEVVGESRWLNAMAVVTDEQVMARIRQLPFVKRTVEIRSDMLLCAQPGNTTETEPPAEAAVEKGLEEAWALHAQLKRMGGEEFANAGWRGKGIRIAVLDGGFPLVDKHAAFQHLRDNGQILKTYNFPKKCENVYGWNSHGTMTLSCIAGKDVLDHCDIGLATEAEFLLARTEVGSEPKKEEVWWVMGLEWADKNGAQIVSSSLGYGEINHFPDELDGASPISKAANMGAAKGILICNSAGNEGKKKRWPGIVLPADADSVLTVGGINPTSDQHQNFSSYGPTADGRLKPNVVAYAYECRTADPSAPTNYGWPAGTSFSCPLVAGFAACAWQGHPAYNAMQLKAEIEKSGELHPYYDYALGYGVPQAGHFTGKGKKSVEKNMEISRDPSGITLRPHPFEKGDIIYYHLRDKQGRIHQYRHISLDFNFNGEIFIPTKASDTDKTVCVYYKGYTETTDISSIPVQEPSGTATRKAQTTDFVFSLGGIDITQRETGQYNSLISYRKGGRHDYPKTWGRRAKKHLGVFAGTGAAFPLQKTENTSCLYSGQHFLGVFYQHNVTKQYGWGLSLETGLDRYRTQLSFMDNKEVSLKSNHAGLECYQHFRLYPGEMGMWALEIGIAGLWNFNSSWNTVFSSEITDMDGKKVNTVEDHVKIPCKEAAPFGAALRMRLSYNVFTVYAQYLLTEMTDASAASLEHYPIFKTAADAFNNYRLSVGIQIRY